MTHLGRVLIVGAAGQVGRELQRSFAGSAEIICSDRSDTDLAVEEQVRGLVSRTNPDVILNAAAYTAVDRAESEPELAMAVNEQCPRILAEEAFRRRALLVHYSTDYVFDGSKSGPWVESDPTNPLNVYGASKLAGEHAIQHVGGQFLIFRTSWVYGPHGKNFLLTMLRLGKERERLSVVNDQFGAPTGAMELGDATRIIVEQIVSSEPRKREDWAGVYHMSCSGFTSWHGFAEEIFCRAERILNGRRPEIVPVSGKEYPTAAKRPRNSVLSNAKLLERFEVQLPGWEAALDRTLSLLPERHG